MMGITEEILAETRRYVVGPHEEDELLPDRPEEFYVSGLLFPAETILEAEDSETLGAGETSDEDSAPDDSQHARGWNLPNSIGLRCNLKPATSILNLTVKFARYRHVGAGWQRNQTEESLSIHVSEENEKEIVDEDGRVIAKVFWSVEEERSRKHPKYRVLSIFLSNQQEPSTKDDDGSPIDYADLKKLRSQKILFQPSIRITADGGDAFLGTGIGADGRRMVEEELSLEMLYRNRTTFAHGYNCSADWDKDHMPPLFVTTCMLPEYQAKQIAFYGNNDEERPDRIDMVAMLDAKTPEHVVDLLGDMPRKYKKWIDGLAKQCRDLENTKNDFEHIVEWNRQRCSDALERINDGLQMLQDPKNRDVFEAFMIANKAMLYQRVRYDFSISKAKGREHLPKSPNPMERGKNFWRPFQIAFILMNLRGIADNESERGISERHAVDLLWFPTGGGKTEAYLGLAAFAMILRRIRGQDDADMGLGVSVIMRYTLRLLTIQQFERAATLICALETFRRRDSERLGTSPFLIGLWVGQSLTPNHWQGSLDAIEKLGRNEQPDAGSPAQLTFCPWCGHDISYRNYGVDKARTKWTVVHCANPGCDFYHRDRTDTKYALPVLTVDFDIYRRCPSMLIATVDKFARLPWKPESSSLFGIVDRECERCGFLTEASAHKEGSHRELGGRSYVRPMDPLAGPDLIVQDELHLITGPLGTMVGLYETAVDYLCSWGPTRSGIKPKIVVSTATIKGVETQIKRLFNRSKVQTFPPSGVNFGDTFFWWESKENGRKYVGMSYSHRSMKFALGRLYAILLQSVSEMRDRSGEPRSTDPYWTLVGYFNSKRELGGATRLTEDDVKDNIRKISLLLQSHSEGSERQIGPPVELTGQVKGQDIRDIKKRLEMGSESNLAIDVLLATNMISVGIDVDRLGLMVISGQPKGASEYIQAAGRIGRRDDVPGIVFTLYNPYKPRDLSHYESFVGTHLSLQKSVEPVGLTPFSDRAMDRALHAVFIAMVRLTIPGLPKNHGAGSFRPGLPGIEEIRRSILDRYATVQDVDGSDSGYQKVDLRLKQFSDNWRQFIERSRQNYHDVYYEDDSKFDRFGTVKKKECVIMTDFATKDTETGVDAFPRPTPGSLRDVEAEAVMFYE